MKHAEELANKIWQQHIEVFESFDLVCTNGNSLEDETKSNALFNAIVTLGFMEQTEVVKSALEYLKGSKYYSDSNKDSDY